MGEIFVKSYRNHILSKVIHFSRNNIFTPFLEDVLSHYMTHGKKQRAGLLTILEFCREAIVPTRAKRY